MEKTRSWETIKKTGLEVRERWQKLADKHGLAIEHWGLPSLTGFTIKSERALEYKTYITQEMLAKGFLVGNSVYVCTEHTQAVINSYFEQLDPLFKSISEYECGLLDKPLLKGPVCHSGFKRLN
jgi:glutamate-1-semialdehyde 2,1-aminomutase